MLCEVQDGGHCASMCQICWDHSSGSQAIKCTILTTDFWDIRYLKVQYSKEVSCDENQRPGVRDWYDSDQWLYVRTTHLEERVMSRQQSSLINIEITLPSTSEPLAQGLPNASAHCSLTGKWLGHPAAPALTNSTRRNFLFNRLHDSFIYYWTSLPCPPKSTCPNRQPTGHEALP